MQFFDIPFNHLLSVDQAQDPCSMLSHMGVLFLGPPMVAGSSVLMPALFVHARDFYFVHL